MSQLLHVCLYNTDSSASAELSSQLQALNFVRLVPEVCSPDDLAAALDEYEVSLVVFHLDPDPEPVIEVIDQVSTRYPNIALLAIGSKTNPQDIIAPMRAGCDQFVCKPIDAGDLAAAVGRVASKRLLGRTKGRCICVTPCSGGAGATSLACNLAMEISQLTENECALIDLDLQFGDAALNFDVEPKFTMSDVAEAGASLDRAVLGGSLTKLPSKISLLARPHTIEQCESVNPEAMNRALEILTTLHENVVVDVPRHIDANTYVAFKHADLILIVCQLLIPSVRNAQRYAEWLIRSGIPADRVEFVVNRYDANSKRFDLKDLEEMFTKPVFATIPNDYQFVARSLDLGRPIAAVDRNSPVRNALRKIAKRLVADPAATAKKPEARRGLLARLFE